MDISIPELEIEDFELEQEEDKAEEVVDESGMAEKIGVLALGQCGGNIGAAAYSQGIKKVLACNTAVTDLDALDLDSNHKLHMGSFGKSGAGKDRENGEDAFVASEQDVLVKMGNIFGKVDRIMITTSAAGGTGAGSTISAIKLSQKYLSLIGCDNSNKKVCVVVVLPTQSECASKRTSQNSFDLMTELFDLSGRGEVGMIIVVDNEKIRKMLPPLTLDKYWETVNNTVVGLYKTFGVLCAQPSQYGSLDEKDLETILNESGGCIFGVTTIKDPSVFEDASGISMAIRKNLEKTLLAGPFDLKKAKCVGCLFVGGEDIFSTVPSLMEKMSTASDALAALTNANLLHRGIYQDANRKGKLSIFTIISGLDIPESTMKNLKRFF